MCVEISAKQGMLIFWLDKHLIYGLSQIATVLAPAQSISSSVRVPGAPAALSVPAWLSLWASAPGCPTPSWGGGMGSAYWDGPLWGSLPTTGHQGALQHLLCQESNEDASATGQGWFFLFPILGNSICQKAFQKRFTWWEIPTISSFNPNY